MATKKIKAPKPQIVFRVKHLHTNKYLTGKSYPNWTPRGRIWTTVAAIRNTLTYMRDYRARYGGSAITYDYENWRVVPYNLSALESAGAVEPVPVEDFIAASAKPKNV